MKLYTEEQVSEIFKHSQMLSDCNEHRYSTIEYLLADNNITPIELPSAEDIANKAEILFTLEEQESFIDGAKWMKEQILGKEDKTFKQKSKWTEVDNATRRLK